MKKTKQTEKKELPYDPNVIKKDLCTLFSPEWFRSKDWQGIKEAI